MGTDSLHAVGGDRARLQGVIEVVRELVVWEGGIWLPSRIVYFQKRRTDDMVCLEDGCRWMGIRVGA